MTTNDLRQRVLWTLLFAPAGLVVGALIGFVVSDLSFSYTASGLVTLLAYAFIGMLLLSIVGAIATWRLAVVLACNLLSLLVIAAFFYMAVSLLPGLLIVGLLIGPALGYIIGALVFIPERIASVKSFYSKEVTETSSEDRLDKLSFIIGFAAGFLSNLAAIGLIGLTGFFILRYVYFRIKGIKMSFHDLLSYKAFAQNLPPRKRAVVVSAAAGILAGILTSLAHTLLVIAYLVMASVTFFY